METLKDIPQSIEVPQSAEVIDHEAKQLYGEQTQLHELKYLIAEVAQNTESLEAKEVAVKMLGKVATMSKGNLKSARMFAGEHIDQLKEQAIRDAEADGVELVNVNETDRPLGIDTGKIRAIIEQSRERKTPIDPAVEAQIAIIDEYCKEMGISSLQLREHDMAIIKAKPEWKQTEQISH